MTENVKRRTFLKTGLAALAGGLILPSPAASGPAKVRLATLVPVGTSGDRALREMGEKWRRAPGGGVQVTVYNGAGMGGEPDIIRRMRIGQIQAAALTAGGVARIDPGVSAVQNMPLIFRSLEELVFVRNRLFPLFQKQLLEKGFFLLFLSDAGWVRFFSKTPARLPEDFKSMKMFAEADSKDYTDLMRAAGFRPVELQYSDILTGLTAGNMIEALATAPFYAEAGQFYTAAKYMLELNWAPLSGGTVILRKTWESFAPKTQTALVKAAGEAADQVQRASRDEAEKAVVAMQKRGLVVHKPTAEEQAKWQEFAAHIQPMVRGKLVPADLFDQVQALLAEYRKSNQKEKKP